MCVMRNFILGTILGIAIAVCGYKPYQIEAEYLRNIRLGIPTIQHTCGGMTVMRTETESL